MKISKPTWAKTVAQFDKIEAGRKELLSQVAESIIKKSQKGEPIWLTFICTHNSRRSHFGQIWAQVAAHYFSIHGVETFSGGTEATAFNSHAIDTLRNTGLKIEKLSDTENPRYAVKFDENVEAMTCFSKTYDHAVNPSTGYFAIMTCSDADVNCPIVEGAERRFALTYHDPKIADGTPYKEAVYQERCNQVALEMCFLFHSISEK